MYPTGIKFLTLGLGLKTMTPEGYDAVIDRIGPAGGTAREAGRERRGVDGHVAELSTRARRLMNASRRR